MQNAIKLILLISSFLISQKVIAQVPHKSETVTVNGQELYYEVYGAGEPLFLLHGGWMSSRSWLPYVDDYDDDFQVYLVDLTGHGRSSAFNQQSTIRSAAEDLNALIQYLQLDSIKGIGYSYGGDVLFQLAKISPSLVEAFIPIGGCGARNFVDDPNYKPPFSEEAFKHSVAFAKHYQLSQNHIDQLVDLVKFRYKTIVSNEDFESIKSNVLMVIGDDDLSLNWSEVIRARQHLPNSDLWVVPNMGHGAHANANKEEFIKVSKAFLLSN